MFSHLAEPTRVNHVSCLSLNARSIVNKRVELASRLSSISFDLVAVTETSLDSSINSAEIFPLRITCIVKIAHVVVEEYC